MKEKEKDRKVKEAKIEESVDADQEHRSSKQEVENNGMNLITWIHSFVVFLWSLFLNLLYHNLIVLNLNSAYFAFLLKMIRISIELVPSWIGINTKFLRVLQLFVADLRCRYFQYQIPIFDDDLSNRPFDIHVV